MTSRPLHLFLCCEQAPAVLSSWYRWLRELHQPSPLDDTPRHTHSTCKFSSCRNTFFIVAVHEFCKLKLWSFYIKVDVETEPGKLATLRKDGRSSGPRGRDTMRTVVAAHFSAFGGFLSWDLSWLGPVTLWSLTRLTHPILSSPVPPSHPLSPLGEAGIAELCWLLSFGQERRSLS